MTTRSQFVDDVVAAFSYLTEDFGFQCILPQSESTLESIHFEKPPVYVDVGWYKGEVDVRIGSTITTAVLRPYRPKSFELWQIVAHLDPHAFSTTPDLPRIAQTTQDARAYLDYYSRLMKKHCTEILRGDLKILEDITKKNIKSQDV